MRKNTTGQYISAQLINLTDGSDVTTGTTNVFVTGDGGTQATGSGTITHEGNGTWSYTPTQAETNFNHIVFTFTNSSAITAAIQVYTVSFDPHDVASLGLTNLDATVSSRSTFNPAADTVANVTTVATTTNVTNGVTVATNNDKTGYSISGTKTTLDALNDVAATDIVSNGAITTLSGAVVNVDTVDTCTTNTDMRGTDNALLAASAPTNFSDLSITATTGQVTVGTNNDKSGYSISGTITTLDGLNNFDPANDTVANVTTTANVTNGVTVSTNNDKTGYSLSQAFPANFSSMVISGSGAVDSLTQGFLNTTLTETTAGRIAGNFDTFFENADVATTKVVDDVGTAISGGGEFTTTEKNQIRYRLGMDGVTSVPSATPDLAQKSDITALNDFDPATQQVTINSTSVDSIWDEPRTGHTTSGTFGFYLDSQVSAAGGGSGLTPQEIRDAMKLAPTAGTPAAGSIDEHLDDILTDTSTTIPAQITSLNNFDPANDVVARVTLVDTTTTNTDMRGTDNALLSSSYTVAPTVNQIADAVWDESQAGHTTVGTFGYYLDSQVSSAGGSGLTAADVWTYGNRSLTDKTGFSIAGTKNTLDDLNDLSFNDVWTGQLTESYAADGVAPTPTQSLLLTQQFLTEFGITTTNYTVKRLNGTTTAAVFTLDDDTNPTSITRSS